MLETDEIQQVQLNEDPEMAALQKEVLSCNVR
jgi:hypothetical protein